MLQIGLLLEFPVPYRQTMCRVQRPLDAIVLTVLFALENRKGRNFTYQAAALGPMPSASILASNIAGDCRASDAKSRGSPGKFCPCTLGIAGKQGVNGRANVNSELAQ